MFVYNLLIYADIGMFGQFMFHYFLKVKQTYTYIKNSTF